MPSKVRPWLVTWLSLGVLIFAIAHVAALSVSRGLEQIQMSVSPVYLYAKTLVWSATGLIGAVGLFTGRRWAPRWVKALAVMYMAWYWVDRTTLTASNNAAQNWLLTALLMGLILVLIWWSLSRAGTRRFFRSEIDE